MWSHLNPSLLLVCMQPNVLLSLYAVKVQRSLAPLSWFPGSRKPTAHMHQCCRFQSYAKSEDCMPSPMKFTSEIYIAWTTFLGSTTTAPHGPRCDGLTLTAYYILRRCEYSILGVLCSLHVWHFRLNILYTIQFSSSKNNIFLKVKNCIFMFVWSPNRNFKASGKQSAQHTVYMYLVIFAVVLFSWISVSQSSEKFPLQCMAICSNENIKKIAKIHVSVRKNYGVCSSA